MFAIILTLIAVLFTFGQLAYKREWNRYRFIEVLLGYLLLFNMGLMSLLAAYGHIFMGPEIAKQIGWQPGSPFQFEIGIANLSYGVLGLLAYWFRGQFWNAAIIGWNVLLLGCFIGHLHDYYINHNTAPYNIGPYIWYFDLILPLTMLAMLAYLRLTQKYE